MKKLNRKTVNGIPKGPVRIVQFGEGNFLRGFVDWMIDILNEKTGFNGNVQIVQPLESGMGDALNGQDGLYHVILEGLEKGHKVQKTRLISSVVEVINPYETYKSFLKLGENPELEFIISNTTEAGITFDPSDKDYDQVPKTFPGKLTALLYHRFRFYEGNPPGKLYILPCELIDKNGEILLSCVEKYTDLWSLGDGFKAWLAKDVYFCNTLVDRIVPGFPKDTISEIQKRLGYKDEFVVKAEPFHLWVIEGPSQIEHKLDFKKAGINVVFTNDLSPYRTRKVRILNGAHTAMVPIGYLKGFKEVREVVEDKDMANFLVQIIFKEIIPTLDFPKKELEIYALETLDRFKNPYIKHQLLDISLNSISKFRVRVLPSLLHYIEKYNKVPTGLAKAFAYLILFYRGSYKGQPVPMRDDKNYISLFNKAWNLDNFYSIVKSVLSNETFWQEDLTKNKLLSSFVLQILESISREELNSAQFD